MKPEQILLPACAQALLTLAVWLWMYYTRLTTLAKSGADPQELADEKRREELIGSVANPSDNFENLFEVPVLFFAAVIIVFITGLTDSTYIVLAWSFVAFRILHSIVHCTYNRIVHRFAAYLISSLAVWAIWIRLTLALMSV